MIDDPPYKQCLECKGSGLIDGISNCCNAIIEVDSDICTKCLEHCAIADCPNCINGCIPEDNKEFIQYRDILLDKSQDKELKIEE